MRKLAIFCATLPSLAMADMDSQFGLGLGTQYGGLAGIKYSISLDTHKVYVGAGLADYAGSNDGEQYGITLGWERALTPKNALGLVVRTKTIGEAYRVTDTFPLTTAYDSGGYDSFIAGTYTYYFSEFNKPGFLTGLSIGKAYRDTDALSEFRSDTEFGLHIGYQF